MLRKQKQNMENDKDFQKPSAPYLIYGKTFKNTATKQTNRQPKKQPTNK